MDMIGHQMYDPAQDTEAPMTIESVDDERPLIYRLRHRFNGGHVHVRVFAGKNEYALGPAGTLTFRPDEWEGFRLLLQRGDDFYPDTVHLRVEFVDDEEDE